MNGEFFEALHLLCKEKDIPMDYMVERIGAAILVELQHNSGNGHVFIPREKLVLATAQLIEQNAPEKGTDQGKFYLVEDFAPGSPNRPPELVKAPFYKNDISLMNAVYFKPASMPAEELEPVVKKLRTSRRQGLVLICDGMEDAEDIKDYTPDAVFDRFCRNGSLLRRITYVLDNGIAMRYPGMYEEISGTEDFQCNWIKSRLKDGIKTTIWSPPYLDTSDHAVVACWTPLLSIHGEKTGMVGFELCYHKLIQSVIQ